MEKTLFSPAQIIASIAIISLSVAMIIIYGVPA